MTPEEIRQHLACCRPGHTGDDLASMPDEVRRAVEQDADLRTEFERDQAFDRAFGAKLTEEPAPEALKWRILANHFEGTRQGPATPAGSTPEVLKIWQHPAFIGMAAALALLLGIVGTMVADRGWADEDTNGLAEGAGPARPAPPTALPLLAATSPDDLPMLLANLQRQTDRALHDGLGLYTADLGEIRAYLASRNGPVPQEVAAGMREMKGLGCTILEMEDRTASMICFQDNGKVYHLLTVPLADLPSEYLPDVLPGIYTAGPHAMRVWKERDRLHVISVEGDAANLQDLL